MYFLISGALEPVSVLQAGQQSLFQHSAQASSVCKSLLQHSSLSSVCIQQGSGKLGPSSVSHGGNALQLCKLAAVGSAPRMAHPIAGCGVGNCRLSRSGMPCDVAFCRITFGSGSLQERAACSMLHVCICLGVRGDRGHRESASCFWLVRECCFGELGRRNGMPVLHMAPVCR